MMPRLLELEAKFMRKCATGGYEATPDIAHAQGLMYLCPRCFVANGGPVGTHSVLNWFAHRGVPADEKPLPGRWNPSGNSIDDLTYVGPGSTSVLLTSGCEWHGFIRNGEATLS
jgi:hypothetical protein